MFVLSFKIDAKHVDIPNLDDIVDTDCRMAICELFAQLADPYVPYIIGDLASHVVIEPDGITYTMPYARKVYYSDLPHSLMVHPLASSYWGDVTLANHSDEFYAGVREIIKRRAKELYG